MLSLSFAIPELRFADTALHLSRKNSNKQKKKKKKNAPTYTLVKDALHPDFLEDGLAGGLDQPPDSVTLADTQPTHGISGDLVQSHQVVGVLEVL